MALSMTITITITDYKQHVSACAFFLDPLAAANSKLPPSSNEITMHHRPFERIRIENSRFRRRRLLGGCDPLEVVGNMCPSILGPRFDCPHPAGVAAPSCTFTAFAPKLVRVPQRQRKSSRARLRLETVQEER